jgi:uncharacterized protein involved in exopolysaccharide biosynthesis
MFHCAEGRALDKGNRFEAGRGGPEMKPANWLDGFSQVFRPLKNACRNYRFSFAARMALLAGVLAALYTVTLPNLYQAEARLLPPSDGGSEQVGGLASMAAMAGLNIPASRGKENLYSEILRSRWMADRLVQRSYHYQYKNWYLGRTMDVTGTLHGYFRARNLDQAVKMIRARITVAKDPKTNVVSVSFESKSPGLAQAVVRDAITDLDLFLREKLQSGGEVKIRFIESRIKEAQATFDDTTERFAAFVRNNRNYQSSSDPDIRLKGIRMESELALQKQMMASLIISREKALMDAKNDMPNLVVLDQPSLPLEKSGPNRSYIVIYVTFLAGVLFWCMDNRQQLFGLFERRGNA